MEKKCFGCKKNLSPEHFIKDNKVYAKCIKCRTKLTTKRNFCETCGIKACYNKEDETFGIRCLTHKEPDMVDVKHKKCEKCKKKRPTFNVEGETISKYCNDCKEPDMVDVAHKKCKKCNVVRPTFNYIGEITPIYCKDCKEPGMVDIDSKKCEKCQKISPVFNYESETRPRFCRKCKEPEMINIANRHCHEKHCRKRAIYSQPGMLPKFCLTHKEDGMIQYPRRKCQGNDNEICRELATFGFTTPVHCDKHKLLDEYCLTERKCPNCGSIDVLNKNGVCVNICSLVEQDLLIKKRIKRKEEFIAKLLDKEIELKNDVIEMWRDTIIDSTCTKARPDFAYHCGTHIVIVEVDEEQHRSYNNCGHEKEGKMKAENIRMYNISTIFQGNPVIFIRYNPDSFKDKEGKAVKITNTKRHSILIKYIRKCFKSDWDNGIYVKYLFYDDYSEIDDTFSKITDYDI